jgi:hypothetical protein
MSRLQNIPAINVTEGRNRYVVETADGYRLAVEKSGSHWRFNDDDSTQPTRLAHFDLRRQVHYALNGGGA